MIVNKYVNLSEGGYPLSEIDLFVLDRVIRVFKKYIPKEDLGKFRYGFAGSPQAVDLSHMESWNTFSSNQ